MLKKILIALVLMVPVFAHAQENRAWWHDGWEWTTTDTVLEGAFVAAGMVDLIQTQQWLRPVKPGHLGHYEMNPLLGRHPTDPELYRYWAASFAIHAAVSYALPKPYREMWQSITLVVEAGNDYYNFQTGMTIRF